MRQFSARWLHLYHRLLGQDALPVFWQRVALLLILAGVLTVRLLTINVPALDRTAWKEIDYIMISHNYWQHGFNFLRPEVSWPAEPPRVTEMEFPLVPFSTAILYRLFGLNVYSVRAVTLFAFLLLIVAVFMLTRRELGPLVGLAAALAAGVMPLYHPFSRFLFSEPLMIAMSVTALFYTTEWLEHQRRRDWWLAVGAVSLTFALKIETLYLLLPIFWAAFRQYKWRVRQYSGLIFLLMLSLILPAIWYAYAYYLEITGAHIFGIFKGHNKLQTLLLLTSYLWYRTLLGRVYTQIVGGFFGLFLVIPGFILAIWERRAHLFVVYLLTIGIYFGLVAEGQIDAPYRQLTSVPPFAVIIGLGAVAIAVTVVAAVETAKIAAPADGWQRAIALLGASLLIVMIPLSKHADISGDAASPAHPDRWQVARQIKDVVGPDSKLVVTGEYSTHAGGNDLSPILYYYTGLQGWTLQPADWQLAYVQALVARGATHFVAINPYCCWFIYPADAPVAPFLADVKAHYPTLLETDELLLLDLRPAAAR